MTRLSFIVFCLFLVLFQNCRATAFTSNSVVVSVLGTDGKYVLMEYSAAGSLLQTISLPTGKTCSSCLLTVDSTGGILSLPMYTGSNPYDNYGYTYNLQGSIADTTTLTSQTSTSPVMVADGQDTWYAVGANIMYLARGTSGPGVIIFTGFSTIANMQLVGTKLYIQTGKDISVMDPIVKSGTGSATIVTSGAGAFYVTGSTLYMTAYTNQWLYKYTITGPGSVQYEFARNIYNDMPTVYSIYSTQVSGTTYVLCVCRDTSYSYVYRFTDASDGFGAPSGIVTTASGVTIYSINASPKPTCSDGFKNQDETDVDCGGLICLSNRCATGKVCSGDADCLSSKCTAGLCAPSCTDGIENQGETDIDCGGPCSKCADGKTCSTKPDCVNDFCNSGSKCATPTCSDSAKNQDETDVDCGGLICGKCAIGKGCSGNGDCLSSKCTAGLCAPSCTDGIKNQGETDIDCGGPCSQCADGKTCSTRSDCVNDFCNSGNKCATPTCSDSAKNQDETDVDCGGPTCPACVTGKACISAEDCLSSKCTGNVCVISCYDGIRNQDETDADCGGDVCSKCADTQVCKIDSDCTNDYCTGAFKCATPTCSDGAKNRDEIDVDCGGAYCIACANGKTCISNGDCISNNCTNQVCADSCTDGIRNQDETDVDCGGAICGQCDATKTCASYTDCLSDYCNPNNKCSTPSCNDGFRNQDESDVDCGGDTCTSKCSTGQSCVENYDCTSNTCDIVCVGPPVTAPVSAPNDAQTPSEDQAPQTSSPAATSTPARNLISTASVVAKSAIVGVFYVLLLL